MVYLLSNISLVISWWTDWGFVGLGSKLKALREIA